MAALPLTPNGKLDTRALPAPEYQEGDRYRAPAGAVEEILAGIYARILGLERVGVDDSFFELGGDLLLAMRVIAAINAGLDAHLAVRALFDAPTVAQLAPRIGGEAGWAAAVGAGCAAGGGAVVVCPESVVVYRPVPGALADLQPGGGVAAGRAAGCRRVGCGAGRCGGSPGESAQLFAAHEGIPRQLVVPAERADFGWAVVDAAGWSDGRLGEAIEAVARYPFDLATQIPLRARLFRVADDEHVLVAVVHHIAADGVSVTPLVADLGVAYVSRCAGQAPGWAPLAVQYVDYTLWQRAQLGDLDDSDSPIAAQLAYWQDALAGMPERLVFADRSALSGGGGLPRGQCGGGLAGRVAAAGARGGS